MDKKKKIRKGDYGYIQSQKKKRVLYTILTFIAPLSVFFTGLFMKGDRNSVFTVVAVVACLPACKFAVSMIMMFLEKPMDPNDYEAIQRYMELVPPL